MPGSASTDRPRALRVIAAIAWAVAITAVALPLRAEEPAADAAAEAELRAAEQGFADAFARRDRDAFAAYLAADAVFLGVARPLRGREEILAGWSGYLEPERPPFSWRPETVSVAPGGRRGVTHGPVLDADGRAIGTFLSVWERDAEGRWRVVVDGPLCPAPAPPPAAAPAAAPAATPDAG
jgi:ketosteroid isomerase-like protein